MELFSIIDTNYVPITVWPSGCTFSHE